MGATSGCAGARVRAREATAERERQALSGDRRATSAGELPER